MFRSAGLRVDRVNQHIVAAKQLMIIGDYLSRRFNIDALIRKYSNDQFLLRQLF